MKKTPRVLILRAAGINRDSDAATAVELAGGRPEVVHIKIGRASCRERV